MSAGETFAACGCPVTTAGVLHNVPCSFGGARARAYVRAAAIERASDQDQSECVFPVRVDFGLTPRQTEAAELLGRGATDGEIAQAMNVNLQAARKLMGRIMAKTHSSNRTEAALRLAGFLKP